MDYWRECIDIAAEEIGLVLTDEQAQALADSVRGGHENYGMAHGHDMIGNYAESSAERELRELKRKNEEREQWIISTRGCPDCISDGSVLDGWGRPQTCTRCDRKGRIPTPLLIGT